MRITISENFGSFRLIQATLGYVVLFKSKKHFFCANPFFNIVNVLVTILKEIRKNAKQKNQNKKNSNSAQKCAKKLFKFFFGNH